MTSAWPLLAAAFLVDGATRPGYDPRRHPVSSLALVGRAGLLQRASIICGFGWLSALMLRALRR